MSADAIHFACIREDARVERRAREGTSAETIVTIASGGCSALSLLGDDVGEVVAVDKSPAQCALVELRRAAVATLDRGAYLAFVGQAPAATPDERARIYASLRGSLPDAARAFWDERGDLVREGIDHAGTTERFYRFVGENIRRSLGGDAVFREWLTSPTIAEQVRFYEQHIDGAAFRAAVRVLLSKTTHLAFFPAAMFANATEHSFGDYFLAQLDRLVRRRLLRDNYFIHQVLFGRYLRPDEGATPLYLTREGYAIAARNVRKLRVVCSAVDAVLRDLAQRRVSMFALSNVLDWSSPAEAARISEAVLASAAPGARLVTRHMLAEANLPPALGRRLRLFGDPGAMADEDASALYRAIVVAEVRP